MNDETEKNAPDAETLGWRPVTVEVPMGIQIQGPDFAADGQLLMALGAVVRAASMLELQLRMLFCALEASKYATITAAGQGADWLIGMCQSLAAHRRDIDPAQQAGLEALLADCREAMQRRNRLVHDVWAIGTGGSPLLLRSKRKDYQLTKAPVTIDDVVRTARDLVESTVAITQWMFASLDPEAVGLEAQLRWEDELLSKTDAELREMVAERLRRTGEPPQSPSDA